MSFNLKSGCGHDIFGACAHGRAYEYYLESIVRPEFIALECDSLKNLQKGKCLVKNSYKKKEMQMGGEPGNFEVCTKLNKIIPEFFFKLFEKKKKFRAKVYSISKQITKLYLQKDTMESRIQ